MRKIDIPVVTRKSVADEPFVAVAVAYAVVVAVRVGVGPEIVAASDFPASKLTGFLEAARCSFGSHIVFYHRFLFQPIKRNRLLTILTILAILTIFDDF